MNEKDVLLDLLKSFSSLARYVLGDLDLQAISWQPDSEANHISHTMWHISRSFDILKTRCLEDRPITDEVWFSQGWLAKTGYDPRGIGWNESGNLAGYNPEEVQAVPVLSSPELISYLDAVLQEMTDYLGGVDLHVLHLTAPGVNQPAKTRYEWIWNFLIDSIMHLGEVKAIAAMYERAFFD